MAKKASGKSKGGKRMADGGAAGASNMMYREPGANPGSMPGQRPGGGVMPGNMGRQPGRGRGRGIGGGRTNYPGIEGPGAGRGLGRPGTGMKPPSMGRPTTGGELPPARGMGPARVDANTVSSGTSGASVMSAPMGRGGSMGADTGLTPVGGGVMTPNMGRDPSAVSAPRTGGGAAASTGLMPTGGGTMTPNMNRDPSAVSAPRTGGAAGPVGMKMGMRGGGLARKGKGQALAKGGLVKGSGCAARGVKKAKYT